MVRSRWYDTSAAVLFVAILIGTALVGGISRGLAAPPEGFTAENFTLESPTHGSKRYAAWRC